MHTKSRNSLERVDVVYKKNQMDAYKD